MRRTSGTERQTWHQETRGRGCKERREEDEEEEQEIMIEKEVVYYD